MVTDPVGDFNRYIYGYLGLAWEVFTGQHYMSYRAPNGLERTFFDVTPPPTYLNEDAKKEVIGLRVVGLAIDTVPGSFNTFIYLPTAGATSGLAAIAKVNDVITHADDCALGDLDKQIPISLVLFRKKAGDMVKLIIRSDPTSVPTNGYTSIKEYCVTLGTPPKVYDYPWYKWIAFPFSELARYAAGTARLDDPLPVFFSSTGVNILPTVPVV